MEHNYNHIDDIIGKHLAGETSQEENAFISQWLQESEANQKYYDQLSIIFDGAVSAKKIHDFNTDAAWENLKAKLNNKEARVVSFDNKKKENEYSWLWKVAAGIIIILSVGLFLYRNDDSATETMQVIAEKEVESDTLPDGSDVYLNKKTTLAYSYNKKKKTHTVKLKGEAYFNINHEDDKQFIVEVGDVMIKDIGTAFNVKAYPESNIIEVVVEEGEIMFYTKTDSGVYLKEGGKGIYNKLTKIFTIDEPEPNAISYKTRYFSFSNTELVDVVKALNKVYDKEIAIGSNLQHCMITVSFNNEDIDEIANIIAETLALTANNTPNKITLEGKGCE